MVVASSVSASVVAISGLVVGLMFLVRKRSKVVADDDVVILEDGVEVKSSSEGEGESGESSSGGSVHGETRAVGSSSE